MSPPALDLRETFLSVIAALQQSGARHAFIGAIPVLAWGRVRATTDIDVVVLAEDGWDRVLDELDRIGFRRIKSVGPADPADPVPDITFFRAPAHSLARVDVFVAKTAFEREVVEGARVAEVLGVRVPIARPEASIIYKLIAQRRKDLDDVDAIFEAREAAGDRLDWEFLERWAAEWEISDELAPYRERFRRGG